MHTNFWNFGEGAAINKKRVIFKNCATFTDCISKINNTQVCNRTWYSDGNIQLIGISDNYW